MPSSTDWTSIPVHPEVRDEVRAEKPEHLSYSEYLRKLVREERSDGTTRGNSND